MQCSCNLKPYFHQEACSASPISFLTLLMYSLGVSLSSQPFKPYLFSKTCFKLSFHRCFLWVLPCTPQNPALLGECERAVNSDTHLENWSSCIRTFESEENRWVETGRISDTVNRAGGSEEMGSPFSTDKSGITSSSATYCHLPQACRLCPCLSS